MSLQRNPLAKWCGVVMIIRPDVSQLSESVEPMCRVVSKRDLDMNGRRAVAETLPYAPLAHWFQVDDGDAVEVYAEVTPNGEGLHHLEFIERASKRDFFLHTPQISTRPVPAH